jgi:hypothetical protein
MGSGRLAELPTKWKPRSTHRPLGNTTIRLRNTERRVRGMRVSVEACKQRLPAASWALAWPPFCAIQLRRIRYRVWFGVHPTARYSCIWGCRGFVAEVVGSGMSGTRTLLRLESPCLPAKMSGGEKASGTGQPMLHGISHRTGRPVIAERPQRGFRCNGGVAARLDGNALNDPTHDRAWTKHVILGPFSNPSLRHSIRPNRTLYRCVTPLFWPLPDTPSPFVNDWSIHVFTNR